MCIYPVNVRLYSVKKPICICFKRSLIYTSLYIVYRLLIFTAITIEPFLQLSLIWLLVLLSSLRGCKWNNLMRVSLYMDLVHVVKISHFTEALR